MFKRALRLSPLVGVLILSLTVSAVDWIRLTSRNLQSESPEFLFWASSYGLSLRMLFDIGDSKCWVGTDRFTHRTDEQFRMTRLDASGNLFDVNLEMRSLHSAKSYDGAVGAGPSSNRNAFIILGISGVFRLLPEPSKRVLHRLCDRWSYVRVKGHRTWRFEAKVWIRGTGARVKSYIELSTQRQPIYLPASVWTSFRQLLGSLGHVISTSSHENYMVDSCWESNKLFPTIEFDIGRKTIRVEPKDYVYVRSGYGDACFIDIKPSFEERLVVGPSFFRSQLVHFSASKLGFC